MANEDHLEILNQGREAWNRWRLTTGSKGKLAAADLGGSDLRGFDLTNCNLLRANLSGAILSGADLSFSNLVLADLERAELPHANLGGARLSQAMLTGASLGGAFLGGAQLFSAQLEGADLEGADLGSANLRQSGLEGASLARAELDQADLTEAWLPRANLAGASLFETNLRGANLEEAVLEGADLHHANLVGTNLRGANLDGATVYGASVWDVTLFGCSQRGLIITPPSEPTITVENLEMAQFIYMMLHNSRLGATIDAIGSKAVLVLGRFTAHRKEVLDGLKHELRNQDLVPIVFDFPKGEARDLTETVQVLAGLSRFVVADLTDARSVAQELSHIVPFLPSVPIVPLVLDSQEEYGMFEHWKRYPWVLDVYRYASTHQLLADIDKAVLQPVSRWEASSGK